jgi:aryl-alcohol dehydrogenase-like predicted oxidoreductase
LTGKFLNKHEKDTRVDQRRLKLPDEKIKIVEEVVAIAQEIGKTPSQVAINWVRQQQHRAQVIPILGARNEDQLHDNLDCMEWELEDEHLKRLNEVSDFEMGFPFSFAHKNRFVYGDTYDMLDDHRGTMLVAPTD